VAVQCQIQRSNTAFGLILADFGAADDVTVRPLRLDTKVCNADWIAAAYRRAEIRYHCGAVTQHGVRIGRGESARSAGLAVHSVFRRARNQAWIVGTYLTRKRSMHSRQPKSAVHRRALLIALLLAAYCGAARGAEEASSRKVSFNHDVRPILSDKCFACHGPDANKRQSDLRLDVRDIAVQAGAITPHKPADSTLLVRVTSDSEDERMPPAAAKLEPLSEAEVETLRRWIEQGAEYENHWSFVPLQSVVPPKGRRVIGVSPGKAC
jgi:hypothetical protein